MAFHLRNSLIKNRDGLVKFKIFPGGRNRHYHVGVWTEADDPLEMARVAEVRYVLHSSFRNKDRVSRSRENGFSVTFWSWGTFTVRAKVIFVNGDTEDLEPYRLKMNSSDLKTAVKV
ncbi:MAG: pYEATS domain-containing protein [Sedimentitalea sp.]|uniref:pYEATS domain-containing protein n=1 Tax=Sedimentitalea sp. TaxID=2048915 RepID=UPI003267D5A1